MSQLSSSAQDYLKAIWSLQEWSDDPVTASVLADRTGMRTSTVSGAVSKLAEQGLVEHTRYGSVSLSAAGRAHAVAMVRRHRLIETFLVQVLHYGWDEVHDEAEHLEHAVSDDLVDRIDRLLGHPTRDPHGDPIPSPDGVVPAPDAVLLSDVAVGSDVEVERISDADPELLRFFAEHDVVIGASLHVGEGAPFSDARDVTVAPGRTAVPLGRTATDAVWVSTPEER